MNTMRKSAFFAVAVAVVFLAGCSSSDMGGILGGGNNYPSNSSYDITGTVDQVNSSGQYVVLSNTSGINANNATVYYDNQTAVTWNGRTYSPTDLERGDRVTARATQSGNRLIASSMDVVYSVSSGSSSTYPGGGTSTYGSNVRGTVQSVDSSRQTISVSAGSYGNSVTLAYDSYTNVTWNGQTYRPTDLERGDEIDATVRDTGKGLPVAQSITVTYNASSGSSGNGTYGGTQSGLVRGTVGYVDTQARTLQLNGVNWTRSFSTAPSGSGSNVLLRYDANTQVVYQGQTYAPANLERGDLVDVDVTGSGQNLYARRVTVVRSVR